MAQTVDIIVKATDKASAVLNSTTGGLTKLKGGLNDVVSGLTGFNVGSLSMVGSVVGIGNAVKQTISEYSNYVESVDKMSMTTGMAAEETSKLIQLADDFRVEQGSLTQAMKMALQNGFEPTTENLAKLSDRYKEIQDPTQRAAEMQKIFGKAWQDMVPLLERGGDAIRQSAADMDGNLVVTQDAIEKNREYVAALDNLQDTITAAGYGIAKEFIPPLTDAANALMLLVTWTDQVDAALSEHSKQVATSSDSWDGYVTEMKRSFETQGLLVKETRDGIQVLQANGRGVVDVTEKYGLLTRAQFETTQATKATTDAEKEAAAAQAAATPNIGEYSNAQMAASYATMALSVKLAESKAQTEANAEAMKQYTAQTEALQKAQENLDAAQKSFNQSFSDKVVQRLDQAGIKGGRYEDALAIVDRELGTNNLAQKKANDSLDAAIKKFSQGGTLEEFAMAVGQNKTQFELLDANLLKAQADFDLVKLKFENFVKSLKSADGMQIKINIDAGGGGDTPDPASQGGKVCFVYETPVNTPSGYRAIGDIQPGDLVYTFTTNGELQSSIVMRNAGHYRDDLLRVRTSDGQSFSCSPDHPWAVRSTDGTHTFVLAGSLKPFDNLISCSGLPVQVIEVVQEPGTFEVFDLSVMHAEHTFLVGGLVVHNKEVFATGGAFTIEPGYANDTYPLGPGRWASSGETVTITPPGQQGPGGGAVTYNIFTKDNPGTIRNAVTLSRMMGGAA